MSHCTVIVTALNDIEAIGDWAKANNLELIKGSLLRYWGGATKKADYVLRMPGNYDIGLNVESDGSITLDADWGYSDFFEYLGLKERKAQAVVNKITEAQNEYKFRREVKKKYKVKDKDIIEKLNPVTGKKILEVKI